MCNTMRSSKKSLFPYCGIWNFKTIRSREIPPQETKENGASDNFAATDSVIISKDGAAKTATTTTTAVLDLKEVRTASIATSEV